MNFIPPDNEVMTLKYSESETGGICAQACIAVIEQTTIQQVLDDWKDAVEIDFKGWTTWRDIRTFLTKKGYVVTQKREQSMKGTFIARVQWIGNDQTRATGKPFYGWKHWSVASAHTHFIVVNENGFFCNDDACWKPVGELLSYLQRNGGIITSYLEVKKVGSL